MILKIATYGVTLALVLWGRCALAETQPNIILVMADDQGWGDTGYNGHPIVKTPELDAMASNGFVFDRFYAAAPVCSPTRASVLTGRTPVRAKVPHHGRYMRQEEITLAETLKGAGYRTAIFGKVHLGSGQPNSPANPSAMGFDEWVIGLNFFDNDPYLSRNGTVEHHKGKGSVIIVDEAIKFLEKQPPEGGPFFMVVWFPSPHVPHSEIPSGSAMYQDDPNAGYFREITLMDQQIGRLRRELRTQGIASNTLLWYCSDNGGLLKESSGGRGKKGMVYEGGLRVPAIIEWPAKNLKGRSAMPVVTSDMYPTLLAMANVEPQKTIPLDGIDVSGLFDGSLTKRPKPIGFWHHFQGGQSTYSDSILKSIMAKQQAGKSPPYAPARMKKDIDLFPQYPEDTAKGRAAWNDWPWKLISTNGKRYELYNLEIDPKEAKDLSQSPEHQARLQQMQKDLKDWMRSVVHSINGADYPTP